MVRCGSVAIDAQVIWCETGRIGAKFCRRLIDAELQEQVSRNAALSARRASVAK